jgi:hypothetical protein
MLNLSMSKNKYPRGYWTLDTLKAEALKHSSRAEFQRQNGSAYNAARRLKVLSQICSHMTKIKYPNGYWNVERCHAEALKYSTRSEFGGANGAAYNASKRLKILEEVCKHMTEIKKPKGHWTYETLHAEALKYDNKVEFREKSNPAFLTASRKGLLDKICSHMEAGKLPNGYWLNKDNCAAEALKYMNRRAFSLANSSAYHGADINGWLDEICSHMDFNPSSDSDAVYVWKAIGHMFNGLQVYKFGTTSARLENRRISEVARFADMDFDIVILTTVTAHASELESQLLQIGTNPHYKGFNGASEFRALTDDELKAAIDLIKKYQEFSPI